MRGDISISDFMGGSPGQVKRHLDGCNFRFYPFYKENKEKSQEVGYTQHDSCEFIEIINFAGERTCRAVEDRDKRAYPQEYARFQERETKPVTGLYLREWCMINPAALADLEAFGLKTVEEVADIGNDHLSKYKFLQEWNRKANTWLKNAKSKQAECTKLEEELTALDNKFKKLEDQYYNALRRIEANEGNRFNA
jgi:hypothetical protein